MSILLGSKTWHIAFRIAIGVFTASLLKHLLNPNLDLNEIARLVTNDVVREMGQMQMPVRVHNECTGKRWALLIPTCASCDVRVNFAA